MPEFDRTDLRILAALQEDASLSLNDLAGSVNLSTNACWRRVKRLEEAGVIRKRVALLDPQAVGCGVTVFVAVRTSQHTHDWLDAFAKAVRRIPEVVEFYRMSGDVDYMLKVVVPDIEAYDRVYKRLTGGTNLLDVSSSFAMEELKFTTELPLNYVT